ncbi:glycosyltransferase [Candidatus Cloacimonadota bacterium]
MKKVLIITYYWPPAGGPGVQRVLKFAKYLPEFGWQPLILTVKKGEYPAYDESLQKNIPTECRIYKTRSLEPCGIYKKFTGMKLDESIPVAILTEKNLNWKKKIAHWIRLNLFIPDAKIGWIPFAVREGKKIIQQEKPDLIFSSSPPPTVHLIAKKLAKWSKLKLVTDFRDPWTNIYHYENQNINPISRFINKKLEKSIINNSANVIVVSGQYLRSYTRNSISTIQNGFDEDDLKVVQNARNEKFTIRYMGTMKDRQYVDSFFCVLEELSSVPEFKGMVKLEIIGLIHDSVKERIKAKDYGDFEVSFPGYKDHKEAIELISRADMLLFVIGAGPRSVSIVSGKLYEYIMVMKPIIAFGPLDGEANKVLKATDSGIMFDKNDEKGINDFIIKHFDNWQNRIELERKMDSIDNFSRRSLTGKLVKIFEESK